MFYPIEFPTTFCSKIALSILQNYFKYILPNDKGLHFLDKPASNTAFIYKADELTKKDSHLVDGYYFGNFGKDKRISYVDKITFYLLKRLPGSTRTVRCKEFKKLVFSIPNKSDLFLIVYLGDHKAYDPNSHVNAKTYSFPDLPTALLLSDKANTLANLSISQKKALESINKIIDKEFGADFFLKQYQKINSNVEKPSSILKEQQIAKMCIEKNMMIIFSDSVIFIHPLDLSFHKILYRTMACICNLGINCFSVEAFTLFFQKWSFLFNREENFENIEFEDSNNESSPINLKSCECDEISAEILENQCLNGNQMDKIGRYLVMKSGKKSCYIIESFKYEAIANCQLYFNILKDIFDASINGKNEFFVIINARDEGNSPHWMLGIINFGLFKIALLDSLFGDYQSYRNIFANLLFLANIIACCKEKEFKLQDWACASINDCPRQINSHDSDLMVCFYIKQLLQSKNLSLLDVDKDRSWLSKVLNKHLTPECFKDSIDEFKFKTIISKCNYPSRHLLDFFSLPFSMFF